MNEQAIKTKLNNFCNGYRGSYCQTIHDTVQTHAIYGLPKTQAQEVKALLKAMGAKKFRTVQPEAKSLTIICFDAKGMA